MTYNRFEEVSIDNPLPTEEVEGETYTRFQPISPTNPFPVMVCDEEEYSRFVPISETNPYPIAMGDGDTYSAFAELSETNRLPVVLVEGESYSAGEEVSMTNPYPVLDTTAEEEPSYVGPLDLVPGAVVAYSLRAMTDGSTADAIRLRESDGDTEQNFALVDNAVDVAAVETFLNGNNGFGVTYFDQSGNDDHQQQATGSKQPQWVSSAVGSKPGLSLSGTQWMATDDAIAFANGTYTVMAVVAVGAVGLRHFVGAEGAADYIVTKINNDIDRLECDAYQDSSGDECGMAGTSGDLGTGFHIIEFAWTFGNNNILVDGVAVTPTGSNDSGGPPGTITERLCFGTNSPVFADNPFIGTIVELLVYNSVLSAGNRLAIRQNMATYYGISL